VEALEPLRSDPSHSAVLLDIDGTLAPIVRHATDAHVPEATRTLLIEIAKRYRLVGCVSGRRAASARQVVAIGSIAYVGNHGGELLRAGATRPELDPELAAWTERVRAFAARVYTSEHQRLRVRSEDKHTIAAFHWRGAPDETAAEAAVREIAARAEAEGLVVHWGRKVLEVRPPVVLDKSLGVTALLNGLPATARGDAAESAGHAADGHAAVAGGHPEPASPRPSESPRPSYKAALYAGDDTTDLDAFRGLRALVQAGTLGCAVCVAVRSEEAPGELIDQADLAIDGPDGVRELLEALL
jgi:trehalose 6-phosphate phosphatase